MADNRICSPPVIPVPPDTPSEPDTHRTNENTRKVIGPLPLCAPPVIGG